MLLGFALGPALRWLIDSLLRRRRASAIARSCLQYAVACGAALVVVWENLTALRLGFWDALVAGMLLGVGLLAGMRGWRPRWESVALFCASIALSAAIGEVAIRIALPYAPSFPPPEAASVTLSRRRQLDLWTVDHRGNISAVCRAVFGPSWPWTWTSLPYDWWIRRVNFPDLWRRPPGTSRVVVHIGDSMVYGEGVGESDVFTSVLGRAEPTTAHVNAGISGIGPQEYLALGRAWISAIRPDLVVTYFFVGNDIDPVLAAYPCCNMEELYGIDTDAVRMRCTSPRTAAPRWAHLRRYMQVSPPPLALRLLTGPSKFARHLAGAMLLHAPGTMIIDEEEAWRRAGVIFRTMRDDAERAGARFALVVLPLRTALLRADAQSTTARSIRDRVVRMATGMGIVTLDAWGTFEDAARRTDEARWFADERQDDVHLSAEGHRLLADWLAPRLNAIAVADVSGPGPDVSTH
jgi:lysophospholipase L1-like esterase